MTYQWDKLQPETAINNETQTHQKLSFISSIAHRIIY